MNVLIFATNVKRRQQINRVKELFTSMPAIAQWNFDLEDCDNILRIESNNVSPRHIESLLQSEGIRCQETGILNSL